MKTYIINYENSMAKSIYCQICKLTSYSRGDIENLYCGKCRRYHNDIRPGAPSDVDVLLRRDGSYKFIITRNRDYQMAGVYIRKSMLSSSLILVLVLAFAMMVKNNTGIVKEFGVMKAAALSITSAILGGILGLIIIKLWKRYK